MLGRCTDLGPLDCLGAVLGVGGFNEVLSHSIQIGRFRNGRSTRDFFIPNS